MMCVRCSSSLLLLLQAVVSRRVVANDALLVVLYRAREQVAKEAAAALQQRINVSHPACHFTFVQQLGLQCSCLSCVAHMRLCLELISAYVLAATAKHEQCVYQ
jgi:hypothetical protein